MELEELAEAIRELLADIDQRVSERSEYTDGYIDALVYILDIIGDF